LVDRNDPIAEIFARKTIRIDETGDGIRDPLEISEMAVKELRPGAAEQVIDRYIKRFDQHLRPAAPRM
jgi:hypothetical protein